VPKEELFIFQADLPGSFGGRPKTAAGTRGSRHRILRFARCRCRDEENEKWEVRVVDSSNFKASTTAMALVTVHPGGGRECIGIQTRTNGSFYISGKGRNDRRDTGNKARTMDFHRETLDTSRRPLLQYIDNTGDTDLVFWRCSERSIGFRTFPFPNGWLILRGSGHGAPAIDKAPMTRFPKTVGVVMPL